MPTFLAQEDVCVVFGSILDEAQTRLAIYELKQSSFSYDVPGEGSLAEISRYLHSSEKLSSSSLSTGSISIHSAAGLPVAALAALESELQVQFQESDSP